MPDNDIGWGQGAVNNDTGWGKAYSNNDIGFGAVYENSPSGDTDLTGSSGTLENTKSVQFDGIDDRVFYSTDLNLTTSTGSYSVWLKKSDITTGGSAIITGNNGYRTYFNISTPSGKVRCRLAITHIVRWTIETDNVVLSNNVWTHIALVHNGTEAKIYIDGVAVSQSFGYHTPGWDRKNDWWSTMSPTPDRTRLSFFQIPGYGISYWAGTIDEPSIYTRALTESEVQSIYNNGVPNDISSLSPISWLRCGDGDTAPTLIDYGSGGNNASMSNFNTFSTDVPS